MQPSEMQCRAETCLREEVTSMAPDGTCTARLDPATPAGLECHRTVAGLP